MWMSSTEIGHQKIPVDLKDTCLANLHTHSLTV